MRKKQSSISALGIAVMRALESEKPEGERLIYDPYARQFVSNFLYGFVKFFDKLGYGEKRGPGVKEFLAARERYIDDYLRRYLDAGVEQVVILGAGFDARAYRFAEEGARFFEVDHPATQNAKLKKILQIFGKFPEQVTYVPIDFNEQSLAERLPQSGYDASLTTLFIWQGVTQYITPEAVDETLAFVVDHAPPGSAIIFDYMAPDIMEGTPEHGEVRNMRRYRWMSGEQFTFGIPIAEAVTFMEARGFHRVDNADHERFEALYFTGTGRSVASGYGIVSGVVKGTAEQGE